MQGKETKGKAIKDKERNGKQVLGLGGLCLGLGHGLGHGIGQGKSMQG
jgi:hypothetical protein